MRRARQGGGITRAVRRYGRALRYRLSKPPEEMRPVQRYRSTLAARRATPPAPPDPAIVAERVTASTADLERILLENVIPFWHPRVIDESGGYHLNHDWRGQSLGPAPKSTFGQARVLWYFSRLARSRWGSPHDVEAARHGYRFLVDRCWDPVSLGFYWEVTPSAVSSPQKEAIVQVLGLYALVEFVRATGDASAAALAAELWRVFDENCHDDTHGGYREGHQRDWTLADDLRGKGWYTRVPNAKTLGVQMHAVEAIVPLINAGLVTDPGPTERLRELVHLLTLTWGGTAVRPGHNYFRRDWSYRKAAGAGDRMYGHDAELLWMLLDAYPRVGLTTAEVLPFFVDAMDETLKFGFDCREGGFFRAGRPGCFAHQTEKDFWAQGEGLLAALRMYHFTGDARYGGCYLRTLDWITNHQVDWEHGDWHEQIDRRGRAVGPKASPWKDPYHHGRALIECLEALEAVEPASAPPAEVPEEQEAVVLDDMGDVERHR